MRFPSDPFAARAFGARFLRVTLCAAVAGVLAGCLFGGTGSDTENGVTESGPTFDQKKNQVSFIGLSARVVDGNGSPLGGVVLELYPPEFRPDSGIPPASLLAPGAERPETDANGFARIELAQAGKFVVEGRSGDRTLFFDTLAVPDARAALYTFRARPAGTFHGKVRLASGMRIDSGTVFIRGTDRSAGVDSEGNYDLGLLPVDAGRMAIGLRYSASPTGVREVTQTDTLRVPVSVGGPVPPPLYSCAHLEGTSAMAALAGSLASASGAEGGGDIAPIPPKVDAAVHSCDSLASGTVVTVKPMESDSQVTGEKPESSAMTVIVIKETSSLYSSSNAAGILPYGECVAPAGSEQTLFGAQVQASAQGSDLVIRDIADKCLAP